MDRVSAKVRSKIMSSVRTHDTAPELLLRKRLHRLGFRYTTHAQDLSGRPDLVFPRLKKAVFVHGCFWHGHKCRWGRLPKSRSEYWTPKIAKNHARDLRVVRKLRRSGWGVITVWQCQLKKDADSVIERVATFLTRSAKNCPGLRLRVCHAQSTRSQPHHGSTNRH